VLVKSETAVHSMVDFFLLLKLLVLATNHKELSAESWKWQMQL
jgi:hypothetical protein